MGGERKIISELNFIDNIGSYRVIGNVGKDQAAARHLKLLRLYVKQMENRADWDGMDKEIIFEHARERLRALEGKR